MRQLALLAGASDHTPAATELFKDVIAADPARLTVLGVRAVTAAAVTTEARQRLDKVLAEQVLRTDWPVTGLLQLNAELTVYLPSTRTAVAEAHVRCARAAGDAPGIAAALDEASARLAELGRAADALAAAEESAGLWRGVAREDRARRPGLAAALGNLSKRLAVVYRSEEAESSARDASALWRGLARDDPAHRPGLATALDTLACCMYEYAPAAASRTSPATPLPMPPLRPRACCCSTITAPPR